VPFDIEQRTFGEPRLLIDAESIGMSALLPRISPDGRYLLFSMAEYGTFHIWHKNSDLYLLDFQNNTIRSLEEVNSKDTESYHSWSSSGRWIVFSTRRDDGSYTRPYIAYFDEQGRAGKPFILPQKDPDFHLDFLKSYNIPEFMKEPVGISPRKFARTLKGDAIQAVMR
jgi:dipeptidyl aminopeptidase/acylaminoacyl peptidase